MPRHNEYDAHRHLSETTNMPQRPVYSYHRDVAAREAEERRERRARTAYVCLSIGLVLLLWFNLPV